MNDQRLETLLRDYFGDDAEITTHATDGWSFFAVASEELTLTAWVGTPLDRTAFFEYLDMMMLSEFTRFPVLNPTTLARLAVFDRRLSDEQICELAQLDS